MPHNLPRVQPSDDQIVTALKIANAIHAAVFGPKGGKKS